MPIILTPRTRGSHFSFWASVVWVSMVLWNMLKWRPKGSGKLPKHVLQERNRGIWISVLVLPWTWKAFLQLEHKINYLIASFNLFFLLSHKQPPNRSNANGETDLLNQASSSPCESCCCYVTGKNIILQRFMRNLKLRAWKPNYFLPHLSGFVGINPTAAGSLQLGHY